MRLILLGCSVLLLSAVVPACGDGDIDPVVYPDCPNGVLDEGEVCDDADLYCSDDCMIELGRCGDGIVQEDFGETCDLVAESGDGGAGGGGGASGDTAAGCTDTCGTEGGYLCDPDENTCGQTGVDPSEEVADHMEEVCTYFVALWGGTGNTFQCDNDGELVDITAGEVEDCVEDREAVPGCTIGEMEEWTAGKTNCEIALSDNPCIE